MELTIENVHNVFLDCLFKEEPKDGTEFLPGNGVIINAAFDPDKIEKHVEEIKELLHELPEEFMEDKGGGWSFLQACQDKNGKQWGEHNHIDELITLGLASGYVDFLLPKTVWNALPGGMPYFVVYNDRKQVKKLVKGVE